MEILFLLIHILLCVGIYILIRLSILKCSRMIMPLVCLVPVFGTACLVVLEIRTRGKQEVREEIGLEKLKINDEVHRSILMEEDIGEEQVVPLEEAFLINAPSTRRELMMEVMYSNPDDYVRQLKEARMNDDTEVVHYAVTALAELIKEYDLDFQELDWELEKDPDSPEIIDRYLKLLDRYLSSGLPEGNDRILKMRTYGEMLEKKLTHKKDSLGLWKEKIQVDLQLKEYAAAYEEIQEVLKRWRKEETGYLLLLQYYQEAGDRDGIDRVLKTIEQRKIYLTPEGREAVRFWQKE